MEMNRSRRGSSLTVPRGHSTTGGNNSVDRMDSIDDEKEEYPPLGPKMISRDDKEKSYGSWTPVTTYYDEIKFRVLENEMSKLKDNIENTIDSFKNSMKSNNNNNNGFQYTNYISIPQKKIKNDFNDENNEESEWEELERLPNYLGCDTEIIRQDRAKSRFRDDTGIEPDFMEKYGIKPEYKQNTMFNDLSSGFNGTDIYDFDCYLSRLLIQSQRINRDFQDSCFKIFKKMPIEISFFEGTVKEKERAAIKAITKYTDRKWPLTASLLGMMHIFPLFSLRIQLLQSINIIHYLYEFD